MRPTLSLLSTFAVALTLSTFTTAQTRMSISPVRTTTPPVSMIGNTPGGPEIDPSVSAGDADSGGDAPFQGVAVNRTIAKKHGMGVANGNGGKFKSNPSLTFSIDALNLFDQRYANNGNQFTIEPPDQGLCAGNGYVLETVNDVLQVFDSNGNALIGPVDLNTFYGYQAAFNRQTGAYGPSITDPSCYYDPDTQRFYHLVLTLDHYNQTSSYTGRNHLDIAVSNSSNPLGSWTLYTLDVTDDGNDGTPNHGCFRGPCLGDYPHIGADAYGIYISTNEFGFIAGFHGGQIYAMSKRALAAGGAVTVLDFDTVNYLFEGHPGFTTWPAVFAPGQADTDNGGTQFLESDLANWADSGLDNRVQVWKMTNTASLDTASPNPVLTFSIVNTLAYGEPPLATQAAGPYPYGQFLGAPEGFIASNDTRMQQVFLANGKLWSANETGIIFNGDPNLYVGAVYYVINPNSNKLTTNGYIAIEGDSVLFPATAASQSGRGIIAFTLTGNDFFPSAAYASLDAIAGAGPINLAAAGLGPSDGFTEYSSRPRWGDYGAAVLDGNNFWIASEYIGQTCTEAQWLVDFTCGGTRGQVANWGTRISKLSTK